MFFIRRSDFIAFLLGTPEALLEIIEQNEWNVIIYLLL